MSNLSVAIQTGRWFDKSEPVKSVKYASKLGIKALDYGMEYLFRPEKFLNGQKYPIQDLTVEEFLKTLDDLKKSCKKYKVKIAQIHAPFPTYVENDEKTTDYILSIIGKLIAGSAYLGCKQFVVHPHQDPWKPHQDEKWEKQNIEMYSKLIPYAKQYGVTICLENLLAVENDKIIGGICSNPDQAIYLIDTLNQMAGEKVFGFCLDIGHANASRIKLSEFITKIGDRLTALHIHDNDGTKDAHLIPYTQVKDDWGVELGVDWEDFINGLKSVNYQGCLALETFRSFEHLPKPVWKETLLLTNAIGNYFRDRINEK